MKTNTKSPSKFRSTPRPSPARVAGGLGAVADTITAEQTLRRCVLTNLLWEDAFYESGEKIANEIRSVIPSIPAERVRDIAVEARTMQKLRHVPLFLAREMARLDTHKHVVAETLEQVIMRPDELTEFLAIYWKDKKGAPLSGQVKKGLAAAFRKFNAYSLAKYNQDKDVKLRDVLFLSHAKPKDQAQEAMWKQLIDGKLPVPDTWEVELSKSTDQKASWERLLSEKKLGVLAFIRNLRNMTQVNVTKNLVRDYFLSVDPEWALPFNFLSAAEHASEYTAQIEELMFRCLASYPKLKGKTVFIVDVSGSMGQSLSTKSTMSRMDAAAALAALMREVCEQPVIYATAGSDGLRKHRTEEMKVGHGFSLMKEITNQAHNKLGGGGIFLCQSTKHVLSIEKDAERLLVLSDSQDTDYNTDPSLAPAFGRYNYLFDISCHTKGVAYKKFIHIDGWSEKVIDYIYAYEQMQGPSTIAQSQ
jgi:hypothetical protein